MSQICHSYDVDSLIGKTRLEARPYQRRIVKKAMDMFGGHYRNGAGELINPAKSVMVESPTGSGKTSMALVTAKAIQEQTNCHIAWVSMRSNLRKQAAAENAPPSDINPDGKDIGAKIEFLSMFTREIPDYMLPQHRSVPLLFIHDEAQHDAAASAAHLHNEFRPDWVLGLSATPYRSDLVKLPFEMVIKDAGIHELIQGGYLSEYDTYTIPDWEPETVADFFAMDPQRWGSSLMFFKDLDLCRRALHRLNQHHGFNFDLVTGSTDREEQIDALRHGEVDGLINCAVLTEGFNFPDLKTVWVRDSGKGPTIQMGGRIFRKSKLARYKQVVQSKLTRWPMIKTASPHQQWVWSDVDWRTLTINPRIEATADETREVMAGVKDDIPRFLKDRMGKKKKLKF